MKKLILFWFLIFYFMPPKRAQLSVIPVPYKVEYAEGTKIFSCNLKICFQDEELYFIAQYAAQQLSEIFDKQVDVFAGKAKGYNIEILLIDTPIVAASNESYKLMIMPKSIKIIAGKPVGVFYGIQTLIQLVAQNYDKESEKIKLPCMSIIDYPQLSWRGLMLDVSRHFFTIEEIKRYIDVMVQYKFNILHLHLTDDHGWRIQIKSLPRLTEIGAYRVMRYGYFGNRKKPLPGEPATYGGFYTHEQIIDLVKYAQDRFVTIVPEIDVPGHSMAAIASYPYLSCTADNTIMVDPGTHFADWHEDASFTMHIDNTLNPANEEVYNFLEKVFSEVAELFPSPYIHIGGDECFKGFWLKNNDCMQLMQKKGYHNIEQLQEYFISRVYEIIKKLGKKMIGWDEIYNDNLPLDAIIMCWRNVEIGYNAAQKGYKVILSPTSFCYLDYYQGDPIIEPPVYAGLRLSKVYAFNPLPTEINDKAQNIIGGQGNLWTEHVPNIQQAFYMTYPRAWALAENFWSLPQYKKWDNFIQRVELHFNFLKRQNISFSRAIYDPIIETYYKNEQPFIRMYAEANNLKIHYTIDGTFPTIFSPIYENPFYIPEGEITLRIRTFRDNEPVGNLIIIPRNLLFSPLYLKEK